MRTNGATALAVEPPRRGLVSVDGRTFPLKSAVIRGRAEGGMAESRLVQIYTNPHAEPLEVVYTLPLPADGAVVGYTITLGERVITGEVEALDEARESYRKALEEGRTAGLLEQDRADTFTQSLGSLPAGATAEIEIRILHPLAFRPCGENGGSRWEYRFPTVVGVRYHGADGRVPDADRLDVDRADAAGTPVQVGLDLVLADGEPDSLRPSSPSHEILVEVDQGGSRLRLDGSPRLDRDVVIRWRAAEEQIGVRLVEGPGLPGDNGRYGLLTIMPPDQSGATFHRDLTILMDASGSMSGWPIDCSKRLVEELLDSLGPEDRFELLAFSNSVQALTRGTVRATERKVRKAKVQLEALRAGGGTEMARALEAALRPLRPDAQRQVILLTDGYIGFEAEVIRTVLGDLEPGCRVHAIGVGSAPNRTLTRGVARAAGGAELFVSDAETVSSTAEDLLKATVAPVLTDLSVSGVGSRQIAPSRPRDVLAGQPVVLAVDLRAEGGSIEVRGRIPGKRGSWVHELQVPGRAGDTTGGRSALPLGAFFGREAVEDLELCRATCTNSEVANIDSQIETLGLRHRITTRRTSLVAAADQPSVDPREPRRRHRLAVDLPAGVSAEGVGLTERTVGSRLTRAREAIFDLDMRLSGDTLEPASGEFVALEPVSFSADPPAIAARVVRCEGELLVIEFESPRDGFMLPLKDERIAVAIGIGFLHARIVEGQSTRPGPHDRDLTLRLTLRLEPSKTWPRARARLFWGRHGGEPLNLIVDLRR